MRQQRQIAFSNSFYRRLTLLNAAVLMLGVLVVLFVAIAKRDSLVQKSQNFFGKQFNSSRALEPIRSWLGQGKVDELPRFDIVMDAKDLRQIEIESQQAAVATGSLLKSDRRWYKGQFVHDGVKQDAKIRIRGDLSWHWTGVKKSWRVKLDAEQRVNGYREINLLIPQDKIYEVEHVIYQQARKMGLLAPDSGFSRVRLNQVDMGVYFWFEQPSKEMLERQQHAEGEMFVDDNVWLDNFSREYGISENTYLNSSAYKTVVQKNGETAGRIQERWQLLLSLAKEADDETFSRAIRELVDIEQFAKWNALLTFFGSAHGQESSNLRWYYDTTTGLFEPMPYDVKITALAADRKNAPPGWPEGELDNELTKYNAPVVRRILSVRDVQRERNRVLWKLVNNDVTDILARMGETYATIRTSLSLGVGGLDLNETDRQYDERIVTLKANAELLKGWLSYGRVFVDPAIENAAGNPALELKITPDSNNDLQLRSLTLEPQNQFSSQLAVSRVVLKDPHGNEQVVTPLSTTVSDKEIALTFHDLFFWTERDRALVPHAKEWKLRIEFVRDPAAVLPKGAYPGNLAAEFTNTLTGEPVRPHQIRIAPIAIAPIQSSLIAAQTESAEGIHDDLPFEQIGREIVLRRGEYQVTSDIIIPRDKRLVLEGGVRLKLAPGVSIVSYGAVMVRGNAAAPVQIEPLDPKKPWGVFGVSRAKELSQVEYLQIRGGSEAWVKGIFFSGQLCFYNSDVNILNSVIADGKADDGLNIKHAHFLLQSSTVSANSADGFDGDWVQGVVEKTKLLNNGNDGLDFSGSNVVVKDVTIRSSGDKGISAGEKSQVHIVNTLIAASVTGFASKDQSIVHAYHSALDSNKTAVSLYQKKPIFGGARAELTDVLLWNNTEDFSLDKTSKVTLTGVGLERTPKHPGIAASDLRIGDIAQYYAKDNFGNPVLRMLNGSDPNPFAVGAVSAMTEILGVKIGGEALGPVGLLYPPDGQI